LRGAKLFIFFLPNPNHNCNCCSCVKILSDDYNFVPLHGM
jgi:hypothetical protein